MILIDLLPKKEKENLKNLKSTKILKSKVKIQKKRQPNQIQKLKSIYKNVTINPNPKKKLKNMILKILLFKIIIIFLLLNKKIFKK